GHSVGVDPALRSVPGAKDGGATVGLVGQHVCRSGWGKAALPSFAYAGLDPREVEGCLNRLHLCCFPLATPRTVLVPRFERCGHLGRSLDILGVPPWGWRLGGGAVTLAVGSRVALIVDTVRLAELRQPLAEGLTAGTGAALGQMVLPGPVLA